MRWALREHAERRDAEVGRGCPLLSRNASATSKIVGETHGGRLASRGRPLRDAKACGPRASANMAFWIGERRGTQCRAGMRSGVVLASFSVEDTRRTVCKL
ncbi:UNVERIFIED_CONTAM: hypothetical protein Sangu_1312400 [Sesamum angustifolium]|uniref:Uncharacterized protein n=1 Tax=Sesamum angustifolium TaxID=2727405 RepID=A0AAW2NKB0_9LAMI